MGDKSFMDFGEFYDLHEYMETIYRSLRILSTVEGEVEYCDDKTVREKFAQLMELLFSNSMCYRSGQLEVLNILCSPENEEGTTLVEAQLIQRLPLATKRALAHEIALSEARIECERKSFSFLSQLGKGDSEICGWLYEQIAEALIHNGSRFMKMSDEQQRQVAKILFF